jgi:tetratricopeptide repeat protein
MPKGVTRLIETVSSTSTATPLRAIAPCTESAQNDCSVPVGKGGLSLRRPFTLLLCVATIMVEGAISAQTPNATSSAVCESSNQVAVRYANEGHSEEAELLLLHELSELETIGSSAECVGLVLNNLAAIMLSSGRLAQAETFAERSVSILEKSSSRKDPLLLRPLQILSAARFQQNKIGKAREAFRNMQEIPSARLEDQALVHGMAAALLHAEGRLRKPNQSIS